MIASLTSVSASKLLQQDKNKVNHNSVLFGRMATEAEKAKIYHAMLHQDICEHQICDELILTHEIHKNPFKRVFKKIKYDVFALVKMLQHQELRTNTLADYTVTYYPCDTVQLAKKMKDKFNNQIEKLTENNTFDDVGQVQLSPTEIITYAK